MLISKTMVATLTDPHASFQPLIRGNAMQPHFPLAAVVADMDMEPAR